MLEKEEEKKGGKFLAHSIIILKVINPCKKKTVILLILSFPSNQYCKTISLPTLLILWEQLCGCWAKLINHSVSDSKYAGHNDPVSKFLRKQKNAAKKVRVIAGCGNFRCAECMRRVKREFIKVWIMRLRRQGWGAGVHTMVCLRHGLAGAASPGKLS